MHWLLIYPICAIAASNIFCYIILNDNKDYFKTHRWVGVFSIISMGMVFPLVIVIAIVKVVMANYRIQKKKREVESLARDCYVQSIREEISNTRNKVHDNQ